MHLHTIPHTHLHGLKFLMALYEDLADECKYGMLENECNSAFRDCSTPLPLLKLRRPTGVQWLAMEIFLVCLSLFTDTRCCRSAADLSASHTI